MSDITVGLPDGSSIAFPAGTPKDTINKVSASKWQQIQAKQATAAPGPTKNYSGNLTGGSSDASSFRQDLTTPSAVVSPSISGAMSGGVSGGAQGEPDSVYEPPTNAGAMGAVGTYRNPVTGQRVSPTGYNPDPVQKFRDDYFNDIDPHRFSIPMQAATALSKNPNDPAWLARVAKMSPIAQQEIPKKAQELAAQSQIDLSQPIGTQGGFGIAPTFRDTSGARVAIPQPHDIIGTMLHGPEGYKQLQEAHGVLPEITRLAEGSLDPENLAFIAAAGAIGSMGKIGSAVVKGGIGLMMGANAVDKVKKGDYGGAAVDAALGILPIAEHPISEAVGKVKNKSALVRNANALDATQSTPTGRLAPDVPYQIPEINRPTAPVVPEVKPSLPVDTTPKGEPNADINKNGVNQRIEGGGIQTNSGTKGSIPARAVNSDLPAAEASDRLLEQQSKSASRNSDTAPVPVRDASSANGIKTANDETNVNRSLEGLPDLPDHTWQSNEEIYGQAKARGMDKDALNVADNVLKTGRAMDAHELAANALKQKDIRAERSDIRNQIKAATEAGTPTDTLLAEYDGLRDQYDKLTQATKRSGTAQSQAFAIRQFVLDDYSHENIQDRLQMARPDVPLNPADKALVDTLAEQHDTAQKVLTEAQDKLDTHLSNADETASQKAAEVAVEKLKTKAQRAGRQQVRADLKAQLDAEHDQLRDKFLRATSQTNAVVGLFDPKIVPIIREIAANRVKAGLISVDALVDHVHGIVTETIPDATKREVRDAISGHGYGSKIPVGSALSDLKKQMRLLSEIEDIQNKTARPASTPRPVSKAVEALQKKKAAATEASKPPRPPKVNSPEARMTRAKAELKSQIDDLTRRISQRDFSMQGRNKFVLDAEGNKLKAQRDALQKVYDGLDPAKQKVPASPEQEAMARIQKNIQTLQEKLKGDIQPDAKLTTVDTKEMQDAKAQLSALQETMRKRKAAAAPEPPSGELIEQARMQKQIEALQEKVASGKVMPEAKPERVTVDSESMMKTRQELEKAQSDLSEARRKVREGDKSLQAKREAAAQQAKTDALQKRLEEIMAKVKAGDTSVKAAKPVNDTPEQSAIRAQIAEQQSQLDALRRPGASLKAREREAATRLERLTKQFNDMKAANAKGEYGEPNPRPRPDTPEEAAMRAKLDAARTERDAMRAAQSEAPPADPLKAYKNRLATQIADMQTHIDSGLADHATGGKTKQLDDEAKVLRDQRDQMKEAVNRKRAEIDRVIEARKGKSFLDKYAIYHRAAILSRVTTIAKLSSAAAQRALFSVAEEGAGAAMHAIPGYGKIAKMAPHGTFSGESLVAMGKSIADVKGNVADSMQKFRTGMNSLDAKHGTKGYEQDTDQLNLFTAPQNAHGAIKTTIQRAAFERSMVQQERYEIRRGNDINDPAVRTVMEARAYMKSKEAILMQDNLLATAWNGMVSGLERNEKLGKFGKGLAATARAALPIVKVPSNFVGELASHTPLVGLARPAYELAMSKGIENLSPEQADIIVTALKKHAVGTALFALGYFNADRMGGFYAKGGNGMNDVKPNEIRINLFGKEMDVPSWLLHSPQMEVMMMGAAFRQAIAQAQNSRSREPKSAVGEALHRTLTGAADSLPFVDAPKRILSVMEGTTQAGKEIGNTVGSLTIPGFLPDVASQIDRDPQNHFQTRKRPAKGFGDAMKLSTGVLRGTVPEDSGRRR